MTKRMTAIVIAIICLLLTPSIAYALDSEPSTLTVVMKYGETPLEGLNIAICRVADAREDRGNILFDATEEFAGAKPDFTDLTKEKNVALAAKLNAYASANKVSRSAKLTDKKGEAIFSSLSAGLYLVAQVNSESSEYIIDPYIVIVPQLFSRDGILGHEHEVVSYPKTEPTKRVVQLISVNVYKVWEGTSNPPNSIQVQLYQNGKAYGSAVTLNAGNYWRHTWDQLNPKDTWTVDEVSVPSGYTKTVTGNTGTGFVITNKKTTTPPTSPPKPPDTGDTSNQQLWTILLIAGSVGLLAVLCALISKRLSRHSIQK